MENKFQIDALVFYRLDKESDIRCSKVIVISLSQGECFYKLYDNAKVWYSEKELYESFDRVPK